METTITVSDIAALTEQLKDKGMNAPIYVSLGTDTLHPATGAKVTADGAISIQIRMPRAKTEMWEALRRMEYAGTD